MAQSLFGVKKKVWEEPVLVTTRPCDAVDVTRSCAQVTYKGTNGKKGKERIREGRKKQGTSGWRKTENERA